MSDIIGNIFLFSLIVFLLGKAVWGWDNSQRFKNRRWIQKRDFKERMQKKHKKLLAILEKAPTLKSIYIFFAVIIGAALLVLFVGLYWEIYLFAWTRTLPASTTIQNLALAFLGTISGFGALFGIWLAIRRTEEAERQSDAAKSQADTAEQGLITDRLNKATEGLGKRNQKDEPVIEVRLGALYALERIAQDSLRDHLQIMEILCAYIRTNSPNHSEVDTLIPLRADIQAAITIIARRGKWTKGEERMEIEEKQEYSLDLRNCDLHGVEIPQASLRGAILTYTNLKGADLYEADLSLAGLRNADLSHANLDEVDMNETKLWGANLSHATLRLTNLRQTSFENAKLPHTNFEKATINFTTFTNADLSHASFTEATLKDGIFTNANLTGAWLCRATIDSAWFRSTQMTDTDMNEIHLYSGDFSTCRGLTQKQLNDMFCGIKVKIPEHLTRPDHWPKDDISEYSFMELYHKWVDENKNK